MARTVKAVKTLSYFPWQQERQAVILSMPGRADLVEEAEDTAECRNGELEENIARARVRATMMARPPAENKWPSGQRGEPRARTYHLTNANGIRYDVQKSLGSPPAERRQWKTRVRAEHFVYAYWC
jgi:hypothetical protein